MTGRFVFSVLRADLVKSVADAIVAQGLDKLGYQYINMDGKLNMACQLLIFTITIMCSNRLLVGRDPRCQWQLAALA